MLRFLKRVAKLRRIAVASFVVGLATTMVHAPAEAIVFEGTPDLALTAALVKAGGGAKNFSSFKLFKIVTGGLTAAEATKLTNQFGAQDVKDTFAVFDYAIDDVVRIVTAKHIALPPAAPEPTDAKALAVALYKAGTTTTGNWDVGYMLEHLITHPIHHVIMHDIDAKFGAQKNEVFHIVLSQMMDDLAVAYKNG